MAKEVDDDILLLYVLEAQGMCLMLGREEKFAIILQVRRLTAKGTRVLYEILCGGTTH